MAILEFTSTECIRPELSDIGYESFYTNMLGVDFKASTLYLNIDPVPEGDPMAVVNVAKQFFGNVIYNITSQPNATRALIWCWNQPRGPVFFHLQSDWVLTAPINTPKLIKSLVRANHLLAINLRAYAKKSRVLCLSPVFIKSKPAKRIANQLQPKWNAERQLRPKNKRNPFGCGLQGPLLSKHWPEATIVLDIGRKWMRRNKYARNTGQNFTTWKSCI